MPNKLFSEHATFSRRFAALLLALVFALQSGCVRHSSRPEPPRESGIPGTQFQSALGKVAVVASESMLGAAPVSPAGGKDKSVYISPAKRTFISCGKILGGGGCAGDAEACAAVFFGAMAICGLAAVPVAVATAAGKAHGDEPIETSRLKAAVETTMNPNVVQDTLRDQVEADAKIGGVKLVKVPLASAQKAARDNDYPPLAALGVDTVLEVSMTQIFGEAEGEMSNPVLPLDMQAHIRLIKTSDNYEIFSGDYFYRGKQLKYTEWSANNAEQLAKAMRAGYEAIGRDISDRVFQLYPFPERRAQESPRSCGLAPVDPKKEMVGDLQPQLSWQSFPRAADIAAAPEEMAQVKNTKYDLIISQGEDGNSPEVIYRREGLTSTTHKIEITLNPNTRYIWSVRARFNLHGRQRVTEWATRCPFQPQLVVSGRLYQFHTPKV